MHAESITSSIPRISPVRRWRVAVLLTHPIQYISPLLSYLAQSSEIEIVAYYQSNCSIVGYRDNGFNRQVRWDVPLLHGYRSEILPALGQRDRLTRWRPFNFGLRKRLRQGRFDALIIFGYNRPYHWTAMRAAYRLGIKVLIRDDQNLFCRGRSAANIAMKKLFFRTIDRYVAGYLTVGRANCDYYRHHGVHADKLFHVPWAVNNQFFRVRSESAKARLPALRTQLGIDMGSSIILFAGKLLRIKGVPALLDAFDLLSERLVPKPYLLLVGDGELHDAVQLRSKRNPHIIPVGFKNQTELPDYYALCDILVLPSSSETWGLVVNEAMNAGKAIVVSDRVGCWPDLVQEGRNGGVFPAGNAKALAAKLQALLSDREQLGLMGQRSSEIIASYSFEADRVGLLCALRE